MNLENTLRTVISNIQGASFSKASLEVFKQCPKTLQPVFLSGSDSEKLLAAEAYGKLLEKLGSFGKDIGDKKITPNDEELKSCEEVIDAIYENNKTLLNSVPEIATAMKLNEFQQVLSDIKNSIQQMKSEKPPKPDKPSNSNGGKSYLGVIVFIIIVGIIVVGGFWMFKKKQKSASY